MILYYLYRLGEEVALLLPLRITYRLAVFVADIYFRISKRDKAIVINNIKIVTKRPEADAVVISAARDVFRNFSKYLVDFFRSSKIDVEYVREYVKIEGLDNLEEGLSKGKGVILLSAHIGNWELGGSIVSLSGYPISAVVLTHKHKKVNDFFTRQRLLGKIAPIEIGMSLKECYRVLRTNRILGLMGDRDFTKNGILRNFFGLPAMIPKGPSVLSYRNGSAIMPCFMVRNEDDKFTLFIEKPIYPDSSLDEEKAIEALTNGYLHIIESYIRRYVSQWYAFKNLWEKDEILRPDTVL